jgi:uncharacterized membrane protein HdeD (DUF308 family)
MRQDQLFVKMGYIMGAIMVGLGIFLMIQPAEAVTKWFAENAQGVPASVLGVVVVCYGLFRIWRARVMEQRIKKQ